MNKIQLYLLLGLVIFATGCPNEPSKSFKNKDTFVSNVNDYLLAAHNDYDSAVRSNNVDGAKRIRNDALEAAMAVVDDNYTDFINRIETRRSTTSFVADVIDIGAGAATGITKGERPNQILGIALTAFRGFRKSGSLNFYKQQTTPILISKMDDNRSQVHATILQKKTRSVAEYSFNEAVRDMVAYYNAGTLIRAFTELAKDTAVQAQQSERRVLELQSINPADVVTIAPDTSKAGAQFGVFRRMLNRSLKGSDPAAKADATEKLRLIYLDIARGEKSAAFKPILDKLRKENPSLVADMDKLENTDEAISKSVDGATTLDIISAIFSAIDLDKQGNLVVMLTEAFQNRL